MAERTPDRLTRLLALVAHLSQAGPTPLVDLARFFGVSPQQIRKDIDVLWLTGTPGYLPQDLIDFDADALDRGVVALTADRGLSEPLRLGPQEGLTVLAALAALRGMVEASDMNPDTLDALDRLVRKVAFPLGELAQAIDVRFQPTVSAQVLSEVQRAIARGVCVDIEYLDFSERRSVRRVEPWALFNDGDAFYLSGWCVTSDGERVFRVDRMTRVVLSEVPVTHPVGDRPDSAAPQGDGFQVRMWVDVHAAWLVENIPADQVAVTDDALVVDVTVVNDEWFTQFLLAHGSVIHRVDPEHVAQGARERALRALRAYDEDNHDVFVRGE